MRVVPSDAKVASKETANKKLRLSAKDPGSWGNDIVVTFSKSSRSKTQILEENAKENKYLLKSVAGFNVGDTIVYSDGKKNVFNRITKILGNSIITEKPFDWDWLRVFSDIPEVIMLPIETEIGFKILGSYLKLILNPMIPLLPIILIGI